MEKGMYQAEFMCAFFCSLSKDISFQEILTKVNELTRITFFGHQSNAKDDEAIDMFLCVKKSYNLDVVRKGNSVILRPPDTKAADAAKWVVCGNMRLSAATISRKTDHSWCLYSHEIWNILSSFFFKCKWSQYENVWKNWKTWTIDTTLYIQHKGPQNDTKWRFQPRCEAWCSIWNLLSTHHAHSCSKGLDSSSTSGLG